MVRHQHIQVDILVGTDKHNLNVPELYRMYQDGWSLRALGRLLGIDGTVIAARFRRERFTIKKYHRKVSLETLAQLHRRGLTQPQMAQVLSVSRTAIFRGMERLRALAPQYAPSKRTDKRWHKGAVLWPPKIMVCRLDNGSLKGVAVGFDVVTSRWLFEPEPA